MSSEPKARRPWSRRAAHEAAGTYFFCFGRALLPAALLLLAACGKGAPFAEPAKLAAITSAPAAITPATTPPAVITPVDIPAGYGYPGNRNEFQAWADQWKIDDITAAAWNLWAGVTSDSRQQWNGSPLPVWETWCGTKEVFSSAGCKNLSRPARAFQFASQTRQAGKDVPSDGPVVSFNKFNPPMAAYLSSPHTTNGTAFSYTLTTDLSELNASWPADTPVAAREVVEAPYTPDSGSTQGSTAMETKPIIFLVKQRGLTPIPLWMGPEFSTTPKNAVPNSWSNCVLLDPANTAGPDTKPVLATREQIAQVKKIVEKAKLACTTFLYAPLSTIYNFKMNAAEAAEWNILAKKKTSPDGRQDLLPAEPGDYGVLVGMHVNSKAIINWTWETFWWQPGEDTPNGFPGSKKGMTANVKGAWRNYAMCTAWNQTRGTGSRDMVVCFNPFLETTTGVQAGQSSNCMSCHGTATAGSPLSPPTSSSHNGLPVMNSPVKYTAPIDFRADVCIPPTPPGTTTTCFKDFTKTDFSWAIPTKALPAAAKK